MGVIVIGMVNEDVVEVLSVGVESEVYDEIGKFLVVDWLEIKF